MSAANRHAESGQVPNGCAASRLPDRFSAGLGGLRLPVYLCTGDPARDLRLEHPLSARLSSCREIERSLGAGILSPPVGNRLRFFWSLALAFPGHGVVSVREPDP